MKHGLFVVLALLTGTLSAQEVTPPRFQGADAKRFIIRWAAETEKTVYDQGVEAEELSEQVAVRCMIDTAGCFVLERYLDNTCKGRDFYDVEPATPRTREVLEKAVEKLERWTPGMRDGGPAPFHLTLVVSLPLEKIARNQDGEPLLFLGKDPWDAFHEWARIHFRYFDNHQTYSEGEIVVKFRIEADGRITILDVSDFPDKKLVADVVRVIRKSEKKWTPRRKEGRPVPSDYTYRIHFSGS